MASSLSDNDIIRHASATMVVVDIYPQILREMIVHYFSPRAISMMIQNNSKFKSNLTVTEKRMISKLEITGYNDLDMSCLYKIIRYFHLLPTPTQGWGQQPNRMDKSQGDDVEVMIKYRHDILHRPRGGLTESDSNDFFQQSIEIAKRMDCSIGSPNKNGFESKIQRVLPRLFNQKKYILALEKISEYQELLNETTQGPSFGLYGGHANPHDDPEIKGNKIPEQITQMNEDSISIYLNALKTGSERRRDISLVIVGKKGVGKTSLVRRLFGENIQDVKSTNGIEIHRRRCRINLSDWEWKKILDTTAMRERHINNRIIQSMVKELHQGMGKENTQIFETSSSDEVESFKNEDNAERSARGPVTEQLHELQSKTNKQLTISESSEECQSSERAMHMLSSIIRPDLHLDDEDNSATLTVWDFAGDKEYYNTHQTFLSSEAIYLVVANLADMDETESYGTFNFWMDMIHCYGCLSENPGKVDGILDPAVITVGTHTDKFKDKEQCRELLALYTNGIFTDSNLHLRSTHLISNTDDQEGVFRELRNDIFSIASNSANWNREYPVKFIQIEKALNSELMNGKRIIPFERVKELDSNTSMPVSDDKELRVFLKYQHEVGNLLFFEDIPLYIILDLQWLANAFKCIVTAEQFQLELPHIDWSELKQTGKMNSKLLEAIFRKQSVDIRNHKEHILTVIEKFDIIIRPSLLMDNGIVQKESCFYIPCMIKTSRIEDIDQMFKVPEESKSTCLCFVFRFLPPHLISSLIVSCLREYSLASVGGQIGLFKDSCVFNISKNGCAKFLLAKCQHIIVLQVWQWGEVNLVQNRDLLEFIETEINRIVNTRYHMKKVSVKKKWKCETTSYSFDRGLFEFEQADDGANYYCEEHATVHKYKDYWSGEKSKVPSRLSSEQQNYVRMSRIVLDVLSSALFDRLNIDTKTGEILDRDKLDITKMIDKYRALKINFPSKGYREIGKVDEISSIEDNIGDDIQRIRVIRNEMLHTSTCALDDTRYQSLVTIIKKMLIRFDQRNSPTGDSYVSRLDEIWKMELKTRNPEEIRECIKTGLLKKIDEFVDNLEL